jgi:hypothetical protein
MEKIEELIKKLEKIEEEVNKGNLKLKKLGFWDIVHEAKIDPEVAKILGKKIAEINKKVFDKKWKWKFRPILGIVLLTLISIIMIFFYFIVYSDKFLLSVYLPIASFILSASLHPITQYITGRIFGIKFLYIYPRGIYIFHRSSKGKIKIEPALKLDYYSYLNTSPMKRAIMHASGAIVTIVVVVFFFIYSILIKAEIWSIIICGILAISYILTDIFYSAKMAAWKHFLEEYKIAKMRKIKGK